MLFSSYVLCVKLYVKKSTVHSETLHQCSFFSFSGCSNLLTSYSVQMKVSDSIRLWKRSQWEACCKKGKEDKRRNRNYTRFSMVQFGLGNPCIPSSDSNSAQAEVNCFRQSDAKWKTVLNKHRVVCQMLNSFLQCSNHIQLMKLGCLKKKKKTEWYLKFEEHNL